MPAFSWQWRVHRDPQTPSCPRANGLGSGSADRIKHQRGHAGVGGPYEGEGNGGRRTEHFQLVLERAILMLQARRLAGRLLLLLFLRSNAHSRDIRQENTTRCY